MKAYHVENIDGLTFWTVEDPATLDLSEEEEVIGEAEINEQFLQTCDDKDKDWLILELVARCER